MQQQLSGQKRSWRSNLLGLQILLVACFPGSVAASSNGVSISLQPVPANRGLQRSVRKHGHQGLSFLATSTAMVHAIDYLGEIEVGTPPRRFKTIFDTGSGTLLLPSARCTSPACLKHQRYNTSESKTSRQVAWMDNATASPPNKFDRDTVHLSYGIGEVYGQLVRDRVCVAGVCGMANFVETLEESEEPFTRSRWDAVLGLAPDISGAPEYNVWKVLSAGSASKTNQFSTAFSVWLGKNIQDGAEITFGGYRPERMASNFTWTNMSEVGYWQFKLADLSVDGVPLELGCSCDGCCQAVLDTGASVMMAPAFLVNLVKKHLNVSDNCTGQRYPSLGFMVKGADGTVHTLTLDEEDYLDRAADNGTDWCWVHFMPMTDPGRGPVMLLGMPFLRKYYTIFDAHNSAVGFALARQPKIAQSLSKTNGTQESMKHNELMKHKQARPDRKPSTVPLLACRFACGDDPNATARAWS